MKSLEFEEPRPLATAEPRGGGAGIVPERRQSGASSAATAAASARYDLRILRALRRIIRGVDIYSHQLAATNQITVPQLVCLLHVVNDGPVTATAISREAQLSASTVVGILDRLEEKGLVARERSREDRRLVRITATAAGAALAQRAPSPLQKTLADALNGLPELEQATIALSLERTVQLMEAPELDGATMLTTGPVSPAGP